VHREVDATFEQRLVDLAGEQRGGADACERHVLHHVAGRADLDPLGGMTRVREQLPDALGLPQSQRATPSADPERRPAAHGRAAPSATPSCEAMRSAARPAAVITSPSATPSR
jgi:hypothetical protein